MREIFSKTFGWTPSQIRGYWVLQIMLIFVMAFYYLQPMYLDSQITPSEPEEDMYLNQLVEDLNAQYRAHKKQSPPPVNKVLLSHFDPNTINYGQWLNFGFPKFLAKRIEAYKNKGGVFRKKEDLKKIYGMSEVLYKKVAPFIQIENSPKKYQASKKEKPKKQLAQKKQTFPKYEIEPFDLNSADTTQLKRIRGIGSWTAKKIVTKRQQLGGFYEIEQVGEIYRVRTQVVDSLLKYAFIDKSKIRKINMNSVAYDSLRKHPYISYKLAQWLVNYRKQHGHYQQPKDLLKINIPSFTVLDSITYQRIIPYLSFEKTP